MIQRILNSKNFIAFVLASATGMTLYFLLPFPEGNLFLRLIAAKAPLVYSGAKYSYTAMLFTTPYIILSILLSGLYIFTLKIRKQVSPARLPAYPDAQHRDNLFLVVGEVHDPRKPVPAENPHWLTIPERGLYTGIAILGAVGTGKTSCCMYPFAEQLIAYKAQDEAKRIGGLVLEVKGDFCHKVRGILERYQRAEDYIEVSLHSEYRYNPLHNDLDAYALAYSIAALLNNLFGKGKEPFWQQAYTNLVKFIILLHKVAYDYVTLFDVYERAISPEVLEKRIEEAEKKLSKFFIEVTPETYTAWVSDLKAFSFELDKPNNVYRGKATTELCDILRNKKIPFQFNAHSSTDREFRKWEQLEAVKRWFHYDWKRIEPKLRTSIVEGISVFLSLFDDNPDVKRTFCPPVECYDPVANADHRYGKPLPSFTWLVETGKVCALNFPIGMNAGLAKALGVMIAVKNIARRLGDDISEQKPILDSRLPDGSRVAAVIPPCSIHGVTLTIRKFNGRHFTIEDLVKCGSLDATLIDRLNDYVERRQNILISGGTGKTTFLNALGKLISDHDRILLIEDTSEIQLEKPNLVRFEARQAQAGLPAVAIRDLLKASLRHRPDRIILGEIRGGEAFDLLQLLNTGHSGTLSTVHASSAQQAISRFTSCVLQSGVELPYRAIKTNIGDSLNVVIQLERRPGRRFVSEVLEIGGYSAEADQYNFTQAFTAN